ncbi:MAG: Rrf2 family transcriptional regulator [Thermomicrobiales bacterium]|nr:Rrf2 family transcriptional regulator [Thermomicrobiales bacterium]
MTSRAIAECSGAHPVVVRQTLAGLREAGIVASRTRRGGQLARPSRRNCVGAGPARAERTRDGCRRREGGQARWLSRATGGARRT